MRLAVVLVHYRTPELLPAAWQALAADAAAAGIEVDGAVVDNSRDLDAAVLPTGLRLVVPKGNLGYAGGVNLGMAASEAELAILANPDVVVRPGCLSALVGELERGASAAGPRFFWDEGGRFELPPGERRDRLSELLAVVARRGPGWARIARRRWRRHARRHWTATSPLDSTALSGALLAVRREAWEEVGPFDEGYPLYFEETDWLLRLRARGRVARFVPGAVALHLHARSTLQEPLAEGWFRASSRRFRERRFGRRFTALLERLDPGDVAAAAFPPVPTDRDGGPVVPVASPWLELSPDPRGFPAAVQRDVRPGESLFPPDLAPRLSPGRWTLRAADDAGREHGTWRVEPAQKRSPSPIVT